MLRTVVDYFAAIVITIGSPLFRRVGNWPGHYPLYRKQADAVGVHWRSTHYYHPTYRNSDLPKDVTKPRALPGLDLHEASQLELLRSFNMQSELAELGNDPDPDLGFRYDNGQFNAGDADALYAMIRSKKPKRIFEIGSGNSSRVVRQAIKANERHDNLYACRHICIEPYEMPWLEKIGAEIVRQRVEDVPLGLFEELQAGDILFIDSSHVIRPYGDVLVEFQSIIPRLAKGVIVHVHDIFTPHDYPEKWLRDERRLWNEQYLLEVMLTHSNRYKTTLALNWLANTHRSEMARAFPIMEAKPNAQPGSFWFEVVG